MTMTDERLAELDAVMAKATAGEWEIYGEPEVGLMPSLFSCETTTWPSRTPLEPLCRDDEAAIVALHNVYPDLKAHIDAQAATIARLEAERVFVLGAGECVTNWGTYGGEPCVFLEPLVGAKGVQGEPVQDSEKHDPHVLRSGSVVLVLRGEPVAFLEDIATARAQENADV